MILESQQSELKEISDTHTRGLKARLRYLYNLSPSSALDSSQVILLMFLVRKGIVNLKSWDADENLFGALNNFSQQNDSEAHCFKSFSLHYFIM